MLEAVKIYLEANGIKTATDTILVANWDATILHAPPPTKNPCA
jgi:hypothetical protein